MSIRGNVCFYPIPSFFNPCFANMGTIFHAALLISSRNSLLTWKKIVVKARQLFLSNESTSPFLGMLNSSSPVVGFALWNSSMKPTLCILLFVYFVNCFRCKLPFVYFVFVPTRLYRAGPPLYILAQYHQRIKLQLMPKIDRMAKNHITETQEISMGFVVVSQELCSHHSGSHKVLDITQLPILLNNYYTSCLISQILHS